jgi:superfamily II DNA or RNA helicase
MTEQIELRPYQNDVIADYQRAIAGGVKRIILVAPTGSGKTVIGAEIIRRHLADRPHKGVLVLAHRREIIVQTSRKLYDQGIRHGIIQAGFDQRPLEPVQVASVQTLHSRAVRSDAMSLPQVELLIIDECHHSPAETYRKIIEAYPDAILLGLTATPCRGDGRGLGGIFETIIEAPQIAKLVAQGHLVKARVYAPVNPDLVGVQTRQGDYVENQLADRMDKPKLIGDIVTHWHKYGEQRQTVAFAVNVAHSLHLRDEFMRCGVRAEHIDGTTPKDERDATLDRLNSGAINVVSNCMVLTEGWDPPPVACVILARPTKKMGLYRQMIGRVLRPAPGKVDAIVLDHSGAVFRHGLPEDHVDWTLDPDRHATAPSHQARQAKPGNGLIECTQCQTLRIGGQPCPSCGFLPQRPAQYVRIADGDLGLVTGGRATARNDPAERERWLGMLTAIGRDRGYKPGWAAVQFKERFGTWPTWGVSVQPITPTPEVLSWVRSRQIAFAKRRNTA